MYEKKLEDDIRCPLDYGLKVFGGKWSSRIICLLAHEGTMRYGDIRREMINISDVVLASALKGLVLHGLVHRKTHAEIPPRVEYSLTEKGKSAIPILKSVCKWSSSEDWQGKGKVMNQCKHCDCLE